MSCPPHYTLNNGNFCLPTCPAEFYHKQQYDILYYLQFATSIIALFTSTFVILPYLFNKEKRKWPQTMHLTIFIIVFILAFSFPISLALGGYSSIICKDKTEIADNNHGKCILFTLWNYIPPLSAVFIWLFICIQLFCVVNNIQLPPTNIQIYIVYTISFGIPIILSIIAIFLNKISGDPNSLSCFISAFKNNGWWIDSCWFLPIGLMMTIGFILISIIFIQTLKNVGFLALVQFLQVQIRLLFFLLVVFSAILIICFYRLYTRIIQNDIINAIGNWYVCLFKEFVKQSTNIDKICKPLLNPLPNYTATTLVTYVVILSATIFPLIFIDIAVKNWWSKILFNYTWTPEFLKYNPTNTDSISGRNSVQISKEQVLN